MHVSLFTGKHSLCIAIACIQHLTRKRAKKAHVHAVSKPVTYQMLYSILGKKMFSLSSRTMSSSNVGIYSLCREKKFSSISISHKFSHLNRYELIAAWGRMYVLVVSNQTHSLFHPSDNQTRLFSREKNFSQWLGISFWQIVYSLFSLCEPLLSAVLDFWLENHTFGGKRN